MAAAAAAALAAAASAIADRTPSLILLGWKKRLQKIMRLAEGEITIGEKQLFFFGDIGACKSSQLSQERKERWSIPEGATFHWHILAPY